MKTILSLTVLFFAAGAQAHCPMELTEAGDYCASVTWQKAQVKQAGTWQDVSDASPVLNALGVVPPLWKASRAIVNVWKKGDANHVPVQLKDFRVFPYMNMVNGHHHGTSSQWSYNAEIGGYVLEAMTLQQMEGCWSLRWALNDHLDMNSSQLLMTVPEFANLDKMQNLETANLCSVGVSVPPMEGGDGHGGHGHHNH